MANILWEPDTCSCSIVLTFEGDVSHISSIIACPCHRPYQSNLIYLHSIIISENRRKNQVFNLLNDKDNVSLEWSNQVFDWGRTLTVIVNEQINENLMNNIHHSTIIKYNDIILQGTSEDVLLSGVKLE